MATLHEALKSLAPLDFKDAPQEDLRTFLADAFTAGQLIVDSVPIPDPSSTTTDNDPARSRASSTASSASEISLSPARSAAPPSSVADLQKEWKNVKVGAKENPLGMSVYKLGGKDGRGSWFARRSVHEGLGFSKWKRAMEREFPETMKVQGKPGDGAIRGIGADRRVEFRDEKGVGKMEVYLLSAQFPGPTTPRDFVTMFLTSDQALSDQSGGERRIPRHFMVVSRPCIHSGTPDREGYIRGQYESVEFIREIPRDGLKKSTSTTNLAEGHTRQRSSSMLGREAVIRNAKIYEEKENGEKGSAEGGGTRSETGRSRGKTISFDHSRGSEAKGEEMDVPRNDDSEDNPVEWIMITRSDPGGSVPRFMIERGTPSGIVADASKFLNWACGKDMEDFDIKVTGDKDGKSQHHHHEDKSLHNQQTNGHLAGIEEAETPTSEVPPANGAVENGGLYGIVAGAAAVTGGFIAAHTPAVIADHLPSMESSNTANNVPATSTARRESISSLSSISSSGSFESALEGYSKEANGQITKIDGAQDKEFQKLEERKRKLNEKLEKARSKKSDDSAKEEEAIKKAEERHAREVKKQEDKYKKEVEKLERKKEKEVQKAEAKIRKDAEKDEQTRLRNELDELKRELAVVRMEKEAMRGQVEMLQKENTALAARVGRLGAVGEEVLRDVRLSIDGGGGRSRASSLRGVVRPETDSIRSVGSGEGGEKKEVVVLKS